MASSNNALGGSAALSGSAAPGSPSSSTLPPSSSTLPPSSVIDHRRRIHIQEQAWTVLNFVTEYNPDNNGTIIIPENQREWAWKHKQGLKKQIMLIDSVFYGYPIPSVILNKKTRTHLEIYDGRHRIETLWRYYNDKFRWEGKLFSELSDDDKRVFSERNLPATITQNATNEQLADIFIRLNSGAALKDYDLLWARRDSNLVSATRRLICRDARLSSALGGLDLTYRKDLGNWVALVAGLTTQNAGNMSTSFLRLSGDPGLGLDMKVDEELVEEGRYAFCKLLEEANVAYPCLAKERKSLKKVGKLAAFFFHDWLQSSDWQGVHDKWVGIIGRLRGDPVERARMTAALSTRGAQNLTVARISETIAQVNAYIYARTEAVPVPVEPDSDDDSDSD
jgi:hypothetical protein